MTRRILLSLLTLLSLCCAVNAQGVPNGAANGVPNAAPGVPANFSATNDPVVGNDSTQGYQVGSIWLNTSTGKIFFARSVATGAAVWVPYTGAPQAPNYVVSNWYIPSGITFSGTTTPNATSLYAFPFIATERITIGACGTRVTTAQASQNFQCAIYANNAATNRPTGAALSNTPDISTAATGAITASLGAAVQIEAGRMYWLAYMGNATTAQFYANAAQGSPAGYWIGSTTANGVVGNQVSLNGVTVGGQTYGTWPNLTSASFSESQVGMPGVIFQVASVP